MKTKRLIELLQAADPSGEEDVSVGNIDIVDVYSEAAFYDGAQQVYLWNDKNQITGVKYHRDGTKIVIYALPLSDVLWDRPHFFVDYSELDPSIQAAYQKHDREIAELGDKSHQDSERQHFVEYAMKRAGKLYSETEEVKRLAREFFNQNLSHSDPFPDDLTGWGMGGSYCSRREDQWDREIEIVYEELEFKIRKKK